MRERLQPGPPSSLLLTSHKDFVAADLDLERLQRTRWRPRDVAAVQVVHAVVAGAPDLAQIRTILHCAAQVGAGGRHGAIFARARLHQQPGTGAEAKRLRGVGLHLRKTCRKYGIATQIGELWWDQIAQNRVEERGCRGQQAGSQQDVDKTAARQVRRCGLNRCAGIGCRGHRKPTPYLSSSRTYFTSPPTCSGVRLL